MRPPAYAPSLADSLIRSALLCPAVLIGLPAVCGCRADLPGGASRNTARLLRILQLILNKAAHSVPVDGVAHCGGGC